MRKLTILGLSLCILFSCDNPVHEYQITNTTNETGSIEKTSSQTVSYTVTTTIQEVDPYVPPVESQFYPGTLSADAIENGPLVYSHDVTETTVNGTTSITMTRPTAITGAAFDLISGFDIKSVTSNGTNITAVDFNGNPVPLYSNASPFSAYVQPIPKNNSDDGATKEPFLVRAKKDFDKVTQLSPTLYQLVKSSNNERREMIYDVEQEGIVKSVVYKNGTLKSKKEREFKKIGNRKFLVKSKVTHTRDYPDGKYRETKITEELSNITIN